MTENTCSGMIFTEDSVAMVTEMTACAAMVTEDVTMVTEDRMCYHGYRSQAVLPWLHRSQAVLPWLQRRQVVLPWLPKRQVVLPHVVTESDISVS